MIPKLVLKNRAVTTTKRLFKPKFEVVKYLNLWGESLSKKEINFLQNPNNYTKYALTKMYIRTILFKLHKILILSGLQRVGLIKPVGSNTIVGIDNSIVKNFNVSKIKLFGIKSPISWDERIIFCKVGQHFYRHCLLQKTKHINNVQGTPSTILSGVVT